MPPTSASWATDQLPDMSADVLFALLDAAPDGLLVVDEQGRVLLANRQGEVLFGYQPGDLIGRTVEELLPADLRELHRGHRRRYDADPRVRPMGATSQLSGVRRSGEEFPVEISLSPLRVDDRLLVIAAVRDVSERREMDRALAEARAAVAIGDDRERIARDLHDTVIQRLFAAGMSLQGIVARIPEQDVRGRAEYVVEQLDETIREIRTTIFSLQMSGHPVTGLRGELLALADDVASTLGFEPSVRFSGAVETVAPEVAEHLLPTMREALANVARHASASTVTVQLDIGDEVVLQIIDDGVGFSTPREGGHGLANLAERAEQLGGSCVIFPLDQGGTELIWRVPSR